MGRPGGFFKKLKAKQKRAASRTQRGTKGASKEDRRRKHNERVEVYAAKREAEQLADVSSSSEDEPSTDSEAEERQENKSLWKLRELLGVTPASASAAGTAASSGSRKRLRRPSAAAPHHDHHGDRHHSDDNGDDGDDDDDEWNSSDSEAAARLVSRRPPPQKQGKQTAARRNGDGGATSSAAAAGVDRDDDGEMDAEDWRLYLGDGSSDSGEEGLEGDEDDEEAELGEETDDADDVVDEDLLMGIDSDDEEEEENDEEGDDEEGDDAEGSEGGAVNPLFGLDDDDDDDGADLFDSGMLYDGEGDEEDDEAEAEDEEGSEEEEEKEDAFVDDEGSISMSSSDDEEEKEEDGGVTAGAGKKKSPATPSTAAESAEQRQLLQSFQFNTSSVSVLQRHSDGVLSEADAWVQKYHLDQHGLVDSTPLKPVPIPHTALEALATSNAPLQQRAEAVMQETQDKKELGIFFVSAEEYATLHPENVAVLASEHATQHLLHAPFDSPSNSPATAAAAAVRCPAYLHPALWVKWEAFRASKRMPCFTVEERGLLDLLQGYPDVFDTLQCWQNSESRREIHALHILNHWFKARSVVVAHDAILAKHKQARRARRRQQWALQKQQQQNEEEEEEEEEDKARKNSPSKNAKNQGKKGKKQPKQEKKKTNTKTEDAASAPAEPELDEELELRDRGFSKTRLCVLCPLRNHAYKFVYTLVSILQADPEKCPKLAMFEQDFTEIEEALDPTFKRRPRDYQRAFEGNIDDSFCVGLRLEPDRVHLYAHPLNSDLLICSPLGLRRRMEKNGDVLVSLSSIEVCVVEEAQMLYQQNWMHVTAVLEALNKRPTDTTHGLSDLRRVYSWALEGKSGRHRQTIVTSEVSNATMLSTFRTASVNNSGKVMLQRRADPGVLSRVLVPVRQHFIRFEPTSLSTVDDDRFDYFTKQMYATKINAMAERDVRIIVFVPSYFDFVRVRNYLHREYRESYAAISEYTSLKQQRKALGQFSDLERPVLLVTERFYFFKRYFVKMAEALVFYSPPMFPEYYASLTNRLVATSPNAFTMTLYCRYDTHELNRLVGTSRMVQLLERESGVFSFVTS